MKQLDDVTCSILCYALKKHRDTWDFNQFRAFRKSQGVFLDTLIPPEHALSMLAYRSAEYDKEKDFGWAGKYSESCKRVTLAALKGKALPYSEYSAHKMGDADYYYNGHPVENKTSCGDWLVSKTTSDPAKILQAYRRRKTLIHWEMLQEKIDITCTYSELFKYLDGYQRKAGGPEMGALYWFKSYAKSYDGSSKWILEMQGFSKKKLDYLRACPYNKF